MKNQKNKNNNPEQKSQKSTSKKPVSKGKVVLSWITPEYIVHDKSKRWYLIAGLIILLTVIISLLTENWSLALVTIILSSVYYVTHRYSPPKDIEIKLTEMGIQVGHMFFPYSHIQAFWIIDKHGLKTLNLRVSKRYHSDVIIQLNDQDPVPVREYLVGQIPEWEGKEESPSDTILRLLKL